jgi:hypothetical protein
LAVGIFIIICAASDSGGMEINMKPKPSLAPKPAVAENMVGFFIL